MGLAKRAATVKQQWLAHVMNRPQTALDALARKRINYRAHTSTFNVGALAVV